MSDDDLFTLFIQFCVCIFLAGLVLGVLIGSTLVYWLTR